MTGFYDIFKQVIYDNAVKLPKYLKRCPGCGRHECKTINVLPAAAVYGFNIHNPKKRIVSGYIKKDGKCYHINGYRISHYILMVDVPVLIAADVVLKTSN